MYQYNSIDLLQVLVLLLRATGLNEVSIWALGGIGLFSGFLGSMLGLGGGFIIIPMLTLALHLPIHTAVASSLIAIVATSCIAASVYAKNKLTNIRLGLLLETATAPGAIIGAFAAAFFTSSALIIIFGIMLLYPAYTMVIRQAIPQKNNLPTNNSDNMSNQSSSYYDQNLGKIIPYKINHIPLGLGISFFTGILSAMLGIGGGIIKVPIMNLIMRAPIKAAIGTSSLMTAITATVGAIVYYLRGYIYPNIVAPLIIGVFLGAIAGTGLAQKAPGVILRRIFGLLLFAASILMFLKAANVL